jgi:hypothetical protein
MSWFHPNLEAMDHRAAASSPEIVECFRKERSSLIRLALLITGDEAVADQCVVNACEVTLQGHSPFRDWLLEWAKAATINTAIRRQLEAIRAGEAMYKNQGCTHAEHLVQGTAEERQSDLTLVLDSNPSIILGELDPVSRAILVLRLAIRSSIQDCVFRLNLSRSAVLGANCRAMTWLHELRIAQYDRSADASRAALKGRPCKIQI